MFLLFFHSLKSCGHGKVPLMITLKRYKKILTQTYSRLLQKKKTISSNHAEEVQSALKALQDEILQKNREGASEKAKEVAALSKQYLKKTTFEQVRDFVVGLGFALFIAILVRQTWFELYEIPSGSMRPTFKEKDRLAVTKTTFGVNVPLTTDHFYFNPDLIQRSGVVIFTVENMDFRDGDTVYFYIFPGKKQLIKRLVGKPGDTLYFYGGKIYGIDQAGNDISSQLQQPQLDKIDHIPFISFQGEATTTPSNLPGIHSPVIVYQMNEPIARLYASTPTQARGELYPKIQAQAPSLHYENLWGFDNFATARLLTKEQAKQLTDQDPLEMEEGVLYLELKHHPSFNHAKIGSDEWGRIRPMLGLSTSVIPLQEKELRTLFNNLYTSRFVVKGGFARRYGADPHRSSTFFPYLPGIPDGTYEFYDGKAYQVKWEGITFELPASHPLYRFDPYRLQMLFNIGIEFDTRYSPQTKEQVVMPARYAYFRDGQFYTMGRTLFQQDDPLLLSFIERETKRQTFSRGLYHPFLDNGKPSLETIRRYGITVPPKSYLVLGDNHANSGDSRVFGFVPEGNLRGSPSFIFWPPGARWGVPNQPAYALFNPGRVFIWTLGAIGIGMWYTVNRRRHKLPLVFEQN